MIYTCLYLLGYEMTGFIPILLVSRFPDPRLHQVDGRSLKPPVPSQRYRLLSRSLYCPSWPLQSVAAKLFVVFDHGGSSGGNRNGTRRCFTADDNDYGHDMSQSSLFVASTSFLISTRVSQYSSRGPHSRRPRPSSLKILTISHLLLAINVAIFVFQAMFAPSLVMAGAKVNSAIASGQYYRLFSPMFIHASTTHLLINSFSLHSTGPSVESWFGKRRFLALYFLSGVCGNTLSYLCTPSPAVGASGAIFGLVGASAVMLARHNRLLGPRARRGLLSLSYIVLTNFGMGLTPGSRIDNFGHLGGFLGGIAYSYMFGPRLVVRRSRDGRPMIYDEPIFSVALRDLVSRFMKLQHLLNGKHR